MPFEEHPIFVDPDEESKLWRYMDMSKFKSLLERRALFFCRADRFADPFEGASPDREVEFRVQAQREVGQAIGRQFDEEVVQHNVASLEWLQKSLRQSVIISCWHINNHESDAMWRLYLKDWFGVAVQTTPSKLKASLAATDHSVHAGRVRYLDYKTDIYHDGHDFPYDGYNALSPFVHKRKFFVHEKEYRALADLSKKSNSPAYDWSDEENQNGKFISVNLGTLIEKVIVPPQAEDPFLHTVTKAVIDSGLDIEVLRSTMGREPRF